MIHAHPRYDRVTRSAASSPAFTVTRTTLLDCGHRRAHVPDQQPDRTTAPAASRAHRALTNIKPGGTRWPLPVSSFVLGGCGLGHGPLALAATLRHPDCRSPQNGTPARRPVPAVSTSGCRLREMINSSRAGRCKLKRRGSRDLDLDFVPWASAVFRRRAPAIGAAAVSQTPGRFSAWVTNNRVGRPTIFRLE